MALYSTRDLDISIVVSLLSLFVFHILDVQYIDIYWYSHYSGVVMSTMASQTTSVSIVYPAVYPGMDQRKLQSPASLAFVRGIHRQIPHTKGQ